MGSSAKFNAYAGLEGLGPITADAETPGRLQVSTAKASFQAFGHERDRRGQVFLLEVRKDVVVLTRAEAVLGFSKVVEGEEERVSKTVGLFKRGRPSAAAEGSVADSLEFMVGREDSSDGQLTEDDELFESLRAPPSAPEDQQERRPGVDELAEALQANLRRLRPAEDSPEGSEEVSDID